MTGVSPGFVLHCFQQKKVPKVVKTCCKNLDSQRKCKAKPRLTSIITFLGDDLERTNPNNPPTHFRCSNFQQVWIFHNAPVSTNNTHGRVKNDHDSTTPNRKLKKHYHNKTFLPLLCHTNIPFSLINSGKSMKIFPLLYSTFSGSFITNSRSLTLIDLIFYNT